MRKLIYFIFAILALSGLQAQNTYPVTVYGLVFDADGNAVYNQDVHLFSDSVFNFNYSNTVATDTNGVFTDEFNVPGNVHFGFLIAETADCNGNMLMEVGSWDAGVLDTIFYNFVLCDTSSHGADSCFVDLVFDPHGSISAHPSGVPPFTYLWSTGDSTDHIMPQDTGFYCVTVTDATGCEAQGCLYYHGSGPNGPDSCFVFIHEELHSNGLILTAVAFGDGPLTYAWSSGQNTQSITIMPGDTVPYCVTVSDTTNCTSTACWDPSPPHFCHVDILHSPSGGLTAMAVGVPPFTYHWNTGEPTQTIFPNAAGDYCVTIVDAEGCESEMCFYYDPHHGPDSCGVDLHVFPSGLGIAIEAVANGVPPFQYEWSNGDTTHFINLVQGDSSVYCVTVTDATGCEAEACTVVVPPHGCDAHVSLDSIGAQGELHLSANGNGEPPFTFNWSTGETTQSVVLGPNAAGYCVTVTDATGCEAVSCDSTGGTFCEVFVIPSAAGGLSAHPFGHPPFDFEWSTGDTTQDILVNHFGLFCVTVTDASGCETSSCFDFQPPFGDSCFVEIFEIYLGSNEHILEALPYGMPPFTFTWSTGEPTSTITATSPGTYCVTVVDAMGCESEVCTSIHSPNNFKISGFVYDLDSLGGPPFFSGKVILYGFDAVGHPSPVDTVTLGNVTNQSYYDFGDKPAGEYLVQVIPNSPNLIPTYHLSSTLWDVADIISLPYSGHHTFDVLIFDSQPRPGPGYIAGKVVDLPGFDGGVGPRSAGDLEGVHILLFDQHTGEVLEFRATDPEGNFAFSDLSYGDYRIMVDIVGHNRAWMDVSLSPGNEIVANLLVEVSDSDINLGTSGIEELLAETSLRVFPNPVQDQLNVQWTGKAKGPAKVKITDVNGKLLLLQTYEIREGESLLSFDVSNLNSGLYFLNVTDGKSTVSSRFMKR